MKLILFVILFVLPSCSSSVYKQGGAQHCYYWYSQKQSENPPLLYSDGTRSKAVFKNQNGIYYTECTCFDARQKHPSPAGLFDDYILVDEIKRKLLGGARREYSLLKGLGYCSPAFKS